MNNLGKFIKERRTVKEWSKRTLAEKAGVSHSEVHRIETGERQNPAVPVLYGLADALGVARDEILRIAGYQTDDPNTPLMQRVFPDLKTPEQQQAVQTIVDVLARNSDLQADDYDDLVRQVRIFLEIAKDKRNT